MKLQTKQYISKLSNESFKSALQDITLANDIAQSQDRTQNQVIWLNHKSGDIIFAQHLRELMMSINEEVQKRNTLLKQTDSYHNNAQIQENTIALSSPLEFTQTIFTKYLSDNLPQLFVPSEIRNIQESSMFVVSYRSAFCRIPFKFIDAKLTSDSIVINTKQVFNYYNLKDSETNTKLTDLLELQKLMKENSAKTPNIGIIKENGELVWFNNLRISGINIKEENAIIGDLVEKPDDWTDDIGSDSNTTIGGNLQYAKSVSSILEKGYLENIEWESTQKTFNISLTLSYDSEIESLVDEYLNGALITAQRLNKFKEYANKLSSACICNCNYCTCDCNYCTCDCNYCTCNCNYCTCNCNYCTCNCNYKYVSESDKEVQYPTITQGTKSICTCDANLNEYEVWERYKTGKGWYNWCYRNEYSTRYVGYKAACPSNRTYMMNANGTIWMAPQANIELSCACDSNTKENKYRTPYFSDSSGTTEFNKVGDEEIPNLAPSFSTAETYADGKFSDIRKKTKTYQICTCDVNTKLVDSEKIYYDVSEYYKCSCNTNKNWKSGTPRYEFAVTDQFTKEGYAQGSKYPSGLKKYKYKEITCSANREIQYLTDWTQFWNNTIYKAGKETK